MPLSTAEQSLWSLLKLVLIVAGVFVAVFWIIWKATPQDGLLFNSLPQEYDQRVDHQQVISWLTARSQDAPTTCSEVGLYKDQWPSGAFKQKPPAYVTLLSSGTVVKLEWGGGLGHYGYLVSLDPSTQTQHAFRDLHRVRSFRPGVYAFIDE